MSKMRPNDVGIEPRVEVSGWDEPIKGGRFPDFDEVTETGFFCPPTQTREHAETGRFISGLGSIWNLLFEVFIKDQREPETCSPPTNTSRPNPFLPVSYDSAQIKALEHHVASRTIKLRVLDPHEVDIAEHCLKSGDPLTMAHWMPHLIHTIRTARGANGSDA